MPEFRYKAFVSYSWSDAKWGKWLHHAIETYRTPKALIGKDGRHGPVPPRLHPLFKDREEEAAGASIGNAVEEALAGSEYLIVICSPRSAASQWVNHEIAWFKTHRNPANILALIVDGEPGASNMPGREDEECFPEALIHAVDAQMQVTDRPEHAPLAADARDTGDGKRGARLKIAAALLGVGLDELVRRDDRRRARLRIIATTASLAVAAVMSVLAWSATVARNEALFQRNESQELTEFMLTDLRGRLDEVGRLDILETVGKRLMAGYDRQDLAKLDADALGRRARVQLLLGEIENNRGNLAGALKTYQAAATTTAELLARDPDGPQRMFDHAQSLYWVGYIAWQRGDLATAKKQFEGYDALADKMVAADPANFDWQLEKSYAQSNLGTVASDQGDLDAASKHFATALAIDRRYYEKDPADSNAVIQYGGTLSWSARVAARRYEFRQAEKLYGEGVELYSNAFGADRKNYGLLKDLTLVTTNHAQSLIDLGLFARATGQADRAITMAQSLVRQDSANARYTEYLGNAYLTRALATLFEGDLASSEQNVRDLMQIIDASGKSDAEAASWQFDVANRGRLLLAAIAQKRKAKAEPRALYETVLASTKRRDSSTVGSLNTVSQIAAHCALAELGDGQRHWRAIIEKMNPVTGTPIAETAICHAKALIATGQREEAVAIITGLKNGGYARPDFVELYRSARPIPFVSRSTIGHRQPRVARGKPFKQALS